MKIMCNNVVLTHSHVKTLYLLNTLSHYIFNYMISYCWRGDYDGGEGKIKEEEEEDIICERDLDLETMQPPRTQAGHLTKKDS